jgi:hypothetical protein
VPPMKDGVDFAFVCCFKPSDHLDASLALRTRFDLGIPFSFFFANLGTRLFIATVTFRKNPPSTFSAAATVPYCAVLSPPPKTLSRCGSYAPDPCPFFIFLLDGSQDHSFS